MITLLKQSTAVVVSFGPFVDKGDGITLEVGLVSAIDHGTTGIMLSKNGGTLAVRHATVTASTYDAHGCYKVTLDTTDTATLGTLRMIYTDPATCVAVWQDFAVVPANVYDSLIAGSDILDVNTAQWLGTAAHAATVNGVPVVELHDGQTLTEMAQGAPPASPSIMDAINYIYRKLRNKQETTATENKVYDDAGTTVLFKETHSDDSTTFTKGKYITG